MFFLDFLEGDDRNKYLDDLIERLQQYLDDIEIRPEGDGDTGDQFAWLGSLGAVMTTRARLDWLHSRIYRPIVCRFSQVPTHFAKILPSPVIAGRDRQNFFLRRWFHFCPVNRR